jgi:DNA-directed RNA polymerase subunit RPC12/RpoP
MYIIGNCPSCGKIMMANTDNMTRTCPHCGSRVNLAGLRVLARTRSSQEATLLIQALKEKQAKEDARISFKRFKT